MSKPLPAQPKLDGRSRAVIWVKGAMLAVALGLIAATVAMPFLGGETPAISVPAVSGMTISSPRYFGTDRNNRPVYIKAVTATQAELDTAPILMDTPSGRLEAKDGPIHMNARSGVYEDETGMLDLFGEVTVTAPTWGATSETALVETASGIITSETETLTTFEAGTVRSDGIHVDNEGRMIMFRGHARLLISNPPPQK